MDKIRQAHEQNEKRYNLRIRKQNWKVGQEIYWQIIDFCLRILKEKKLVSFTQKI
uniref:Uncharacterized protein n=1 Tax=Megaselia scalaris TaxID=36166 RepID=T1GSL8_MEGSC